MTRLAATAAPLACLVALALSGCMPREVPPPLERIGCHLSSPEDLRRINRVVLVALGDTVNQPQIAGELTAALYREIQDKGLFHLCVIGRNEAACRDLPLTKHEPFTLEELSQLRDALHCDAVLLGTMTCFQPHPRMQAGLYLTLLDLNDGRAVWGVDHVWDTTNRQTERQLQAFFARRMRDAYSPAGWRIGTMSPKAFAEFVAYEVAETLTPPATPLPRSARRAGAGRELRQGAERMTASALKKTEDTARMIVSGPFGSDHAD